MKSSKIIAEKVENGVKLYLLQCESCGFVTPGWTRKTKLGCVCNSASPPPPAEGPGTELKRLLTMMRFVSTDDCMCDQHAAEMNREGPLWCRQNLETIVGWLEDESKKRPIAKFVFSRLAARRLVLQAIRNAEKKLAGDKVDAHNSSHEIGDRNDDGSSRATDNRGVP